jgi:hypothetical protein
MRGQNLRAEFCPGKHTNKHIHTHTHTHTHTPHESTLTGADNDEYEEAKEVWVDGSLLFFLRHAARQPTKSKAKQVIILSR